MRQSQEVRRQDYYLTDKKLLFSDDTGYRYCVPQDRALDVVTIYHSQGHPGVPKMLSLLGRRYIFSIPMNELYHMCTKLCHHCQICQALKPRRGQVPRTMDFCPIPSDIFTSIWMDCVDLDPRLRGSSVELLFGSTIQIKWICICHTLQEVGTNGKEGSPDVYGGVHFVRGNPK